MEIKVKKIVTKAVKLKNLKQSAKNLIICSYRKKSDHCLNNCFHGIPHKIEIERDAKCHTHSEICKIPKGIIKVICRKLNKKQQKEWIEKELNK